MNANKLGAATRLMAAEGPAPKLLSTAKACIHLMADPDTDIKRVSGQPDEVKFAVLGEMAGELFMDAAKALKVASLLKAGGVQVSIAAVRKGCTAVTFSLADA